MFLPSKKTKGEFNTQERILMGITTAPYLLAISLIAYGKMTMDYKFWLYGMISLIIGWLLSSYIGFTKQFYFPITSFQFPVKGNRAKRYAVIDLVLTIITISIIIYLQYNYNFINKLGLFQ